jgi:hypothetical protein
MTDRKRVPDPESIIGEFGPELERLLQLSMMLPLEGRPCFELAEDLLEYALRPRPETE